MRKPRTYVRALCVLQKIEQYSESTGVSSTVRRIEGKGQRYRDGTERDTVQKEDRDGRRRKHRKRDRWWRKCRKGVNGRKLYLH